MDRRLKFVVNNVEFIERALDKMVGEIAADVDRMFETELVEDASPFLPDRPGTATEIVTALATDNAEIDLSVPALHTAGQIRRFFSRYCR